MINFFYKIYFPFLIWLTNFLPKKSKNKILNNLLLWNNNIILSKKENEKPKNILILLPRCLQYFKCEHNIIASVENCQLCGKCKIKDIIKIKEKYNLRDVKVVSGGKLAKMFVEQIKPDYIIAVACEIELILGIKEVFPYRVLAVNNIIIDKPCINTDVEIEKIENFIKQLL